MDIFHALTQEIESVISCHWLDEFRGRTRSFRGNSAKSSRGGSIASASANSRSGSLSQASEVTRERSASVGSVLSRTGSAFSVGFEGLDEKEGKMSNSGTGAEMDTQNTEAGGEQTQYEAVATHVQSPAKQHGQLGQASEMTSDENPSGVSKERGEQTADNIRYGQQISENGVGGFTNTTEGQANTEGGYGGEKAQSDLEETDVNSRTSQGYTAKNAVHNNNIGA